MVTAEHARRITEQNETPIFQTVTRNIIKTAENGSRSVSMTVDGWELYQIQERLKRLGYEVVEDDFDLEQSTTNITISW